MHEIKPTAGLAKPEAYRDLLAQLTAVLAGERDGLANTANLADDLLTQMYHNSKKTGAAAAPTMAAERSGSTGVTSKG